MKLQNFHFFFSKKNENKKIFFNFRKKTKKSQKNGLFSRPPKIRQKAGFSSSAKKNPGPNFPREKNAKSVKHGVPPVFATFCHFSPLFLGPFFLRKIKIEKLN